MSNPLAIAAVTAVLRARIREALGGSWTAEIDRTRLLSMPPDHVLASEETGPVVNVFLCAVQPAQDRRSLPDRDRRSLASGPLPLNLTYVISAHGILPLDADILLGQAIAAIHEKPVITPDEIRSALDPGVNDPTGITSRAFRQAAVKLADNPDRVTLTMRVSTPEETAAMWKSFGTPYRPSVLVDVIGFVL